MNAVKKWHYIEAYNYLLGYFFILEVFIIFATAYVNKSNLLWKELGDGSAKTIKLRLPCLDKLEWKA